MDEEEGEESVIDAFRIGYTSGSRPRKREDDELSDTSHISAASSLPSVVDSIFTVASGSSMSSLPGSQGADERLVALLLEDSVVRDVCSGGLLVIEKERLERNLRRLLKDFATELRKEADTVQQRQAANFVRFRARNSAHIICNALTEALTKNLQSGVDERIRNEAEEEDHDSDDENSDRSEDEVQNLQQLELFIKTSRAFEIFRTKLTMFVYPSEERLDQTREDLEVDREDGKNEYRDLHDTESQSSIQDELPRIDSQNLQNMSRGATFMPIFNMMMKPLRKERPFIPSGKTRVEWQCVCSSTLSNKKLTAGTEMWTHDLRRLHRAYTRSSRTT